MKKYYYLDYSGMFTKVLVEDLPLLNLPKWIEEVTYEEYIEFINVSEEDDTIYWWMD